MEPTPAGGPTASRGEQEFAQLINTVLKERVLPKQFTGGAGGGGRAE